MKQRGGHKVTAKRWEQEVPVTLSVEVPDANGEGVVMRKPAVLPFLPRIGDELGVGHDGDYMRVDGVFWCPGDGLTIWFEDLDLKHLHAALLKEAWVEE